MEDENKHTVGLFSGDTLLGKIASAPVGEGSTAPVKWHAEVIATENIGILNKPNISTVRDSEDSAKN